MQELINGYKKEGVMIGELKENNKIIKFILGGNAIFTIQNIQSGNRYTYKVQRKEVSKDKVMWFVKLLSGPNNVLDYTYLGMIHDMKFKATKATRNAGVPFKAFQWFWTTLLKEKSLPKKVKFYHSGRCGRCGRKLTVPKSIESGFGPECIKYII